jgi:hypothetical protein
MEDNSDMETWLLKLNLERSGESDFRNPGAFCQASLASLWKHRSAVLDAQNARRTSVKIECNNECFVFDNLSESTRVGDLKFFLEQKDGALSAIFLHCFVRSSSNSNMPAFELPNHFQLRDIPFEIETELDLVCVVIPKDVFEINDLFDAGSFSADRLIYFGQQDIISCLLFSV